MDLPIPDYWLPRPAMELDDATRLAFDELLKAAQGNAPINYTLAVPKWQFLCYAAEHGGLAMHGSGNANIAEFEPRQSNDLNEFGNRKAVYAAADGLWAMFFAIVDRDRFSGMSITNACIRLAHPTEGWVSEPRYVFSVSDKALPHAPWREGVVYLLPRTTFETQAPMSFGPFEVRIAQLASLEPVTPLARLQISPSDFPFLAQIRGHDDARLAEYAHALSTGAPWPQ